MSDRSVKPESSQAPGGPAMERRGVRGAERIPLWEALLPVVLFAVSQPVVSVLVSVWMLPFLSPQLNPREVEDALTRVVLPLLIVVSHGVGWLALYWVLGVRHGAGLLRGLRLEGLRRFRIGRLFLAGMALQVVAVALGVLLPQPDGLENPVLRFATYGRWAVALLVVMAGVMAPLLEEALFRGLLLPALRRRMGFVPAALLVTALFAALHAVQTQGYIPALAAIALAGFMLAWLREASGSLWPPVIFHMGFNFTALLPLLLLGGDLEGLEAGLLTGWGEVVKPLAAAALPAAAVPFQALLAAWLIVRGG